MSALLRRHGRTSWTERDPVPIAVGGLVVLALLFLLTLNWQRLPFVDSTTTYRAVFTDASGLVPGEEVRIAGVKVGSVKSITLDGATVVVEFGVSGVDLGDRTEAGIEVKTLLGQHYLSVTPSGTEPMPAGATIPLARTRTPVNIVPAFNRLAEATQQTDTAQLADAFDALSATLERTAPQMTPALEGLSRLSLSVSSRDERIRDLLSRARQVSGVVADRDQELGELLTASQQVLATLDTRREALVRIIGGTADLARQLRGLVEDNRAALKPALRDLDSVLAVLRSNERNLEQTLTYAAPYAREFTNVGGSGQWFDSSIKTFRGAAVCSTGDSTSLLGNLLDPLLSAINTAVNGSDLPCLPLGPATGSSTQLPAGAAGTGGR
ncbi:MCE family protein [Nocardioides fonticola]|uniref:MCE family protein n=1 Tax=Nocardioides fonticola TaxID=450363 RepID=A0ABP7XGZ6_9ACTN